MRDRQRNAVKTAVWKDGYSEVQAGRKYKESVSKQQGFTLYVKVQKQDSSLWLILVAWEQSGGQARVRQGMAKETMASK